MRNNFQSSVVPRGTRTIWRYLGALFILFTFAIGNVWAQTSWVRLDSIDFTNTTDFPAQTITGANSAVTTATINGVFFRAKAKKSIKINNTTAGVDFDSQNGDASSHHFGIPVTGVNSSIKVIIYHDYNNTSANFKMGISHATDNDPSGTQTWDLSVGNSGATKNANDWVMTKSGLTGSEYIVWAMEAGSSYKVIKKIAIYTEAPTGYSVTYVENGHGATQTDLTGQTALPNPLPTLSESGWIFGGWFTNEGLTDAAVAGASISANTTLYAKWTEDTSVTKYEVTYNLGGASGTAPTQEDVAEGTVITLAAAPSWAGHAFDGWLCSADSKTKAAGSSYTMTAAATTFTAQWHEVDCKIYSFTGGIGSAVPQTTNATVDAEKMFVKDNGDKIRFTPASGESFKVGDVITFSGNLNNLSKKFGLKLYANGGGSVSQTIENAVGTEPLICSAALTFNADYFDVSRADGTGTTLYTMEVHRACAEGIAAGLSFAETEIDKTEGDAAFTNALTNPNGLVIAGYKSSNAGVATVATNGQVTVVGPGSATITAYSAIQTKAGTLYAAGTATYTLTVAALPKYHVTYDLNGGSGDVAEVDHKAGEKFNLHDGVTGITAPANKTFINWKDQDDNVYEGGVEFTMPGKDVTLTAQWAGDVYTVKFMDGETLLDTKVVEVGSHPTDIEHPTKPLYTFAAWQLSGSDVILDEVSGTKDATVILTARWAAAYASNVNFKEAATQELGVETALNTYHYASDAGDISFEAKGLKIKTNAARFYFNVAPGKVAEIKFGNISGATYSVDGGAAETLTSSQLKATYSASAQSCVMTMTTDAYNIVEKVTIHDPYEVSYDANGGDPVSSQYATPSVTLPSASKGTASLLGWFIGEDKIGEAGDSYTPTANVELVAHWEDISTDARLASISFSSDAGTLEPAFDPEVVNYTYTMPYPTAAVPTITGATSVSAKAQDPEIVSQAAAWNETAVIRGVAESGDKKAYNITMKIAPKDGVSLVKIVPTSQTKGTQTGLYHDGDELTINLSSGMNLGGSGKYIGVKATENFQEGDVLHLDLNTKPNTTAGTQIILYAEKEATNEVWATGVDAMVDNDYYLTLPAAVNGHNALYIVRTDGNKWNGGPAIMEVTRVMMPELTAISFNGEAATKGTGNAFSVTLPQATTDLADLTIVPTVIRNAAHATTPEAVVGGTWAEGDNTYRVMDKDGDYTDYTITITLLGASVAPTITTQPAGANYVEGASIAALTVVAESAAGELSYQWQVKNGLNYDDIDGATAASYAPAISAIGSYTYRVVVTNTEESKPATSVESEDATIVIAADPSCATFVEASIPTEEPYQYTNTGEWTIYNASSSGKRNGSDQVFTNVKDFDGNTVKGFAKERCVLIFEKDMKQVRFYSANAQRAWGSTPVQVSGDVEAFLGTSTPSYSADAATTSIIQADPSNDKEQIFIANGEFLAGKCYWFAFSGSLQIFQICAVEADPKADAPVFSGTLSDEAICPGNSFTELDATASPVTSYAWYKDDEVIAGATEATYTPTEAGTYYCIATNSAAGHRDNSLKSAEAILTVNEAASVSMENASGKADQTVILNAVATGADIHYAWFTCDDAEGTNALPIAGADDAASYTVPNPVTTQYYKVVVSTACGDASAVALVTLLPDVIEQVDVTETTSWNLVGIVSAETNIDATILLANVDGVTLANSDKLNVDAGKIRTGYYQGYGLSFRTTVPGLLTVEFSNTGSSTRPYRELIVNGNPTGVKSKTSASHETCHVQVGAGNVELTVIIYDNDGNPTTAASTLNFFKVAFQTADYDRPVNPANIGTLCWTNNAILGGATLYELAGKNENNYLVFDEVAENRLEAGKPYIFVPENGNTEIKVYNTDTEDALTQDDLQAVNGMHGTFVDLSTIEDGENSPLWKKYIISNNHYVYVDYTNCRLGAYRAYITSLDDIAPAAAEPEPNTNGAPRRRIVMGGQGTNTTTGVDELNAAEAPVKMMIDGQLFILRGEKMYDATGRLVK